MKAFGFRASEDLVVSLLRQKLDFTEEENLTLTSPEDFLAYAVTHLHAPTQAAAGRVPLRADGRSRL